jgi:AraC family transcriptional regulator
MGRQNWQADYSISIEAKLDTTDVAVDLTSFNFPRLFCSDVLQFPEDVLLLQLGATPQAEVHVGATTHLGTTSRVGALSFWPAGSYLQGSSLRGGQFRGLNCVFRGAWFRNLMEVAQERPGMPLPVCADLRNDRLTNVLGTLADEILKPDFATATLAEGLGRQLAGELARHFRYVSSGSDLRRQALMPWQIKRVLNYLDALPGPALDYEEVADLCGLSTRHFRRLFKEAMDRSLQDYARDVWVEKAKARLRETRMPFEHIWPALGFVSSSHFSNAFRRATGQTPTSYRRQFQATSDAPSST